MVTEGDLNSASKAKAERIREVIRLLKLTIDACRKVLDQLENVNRDDPN